MVYKDNNLNRNNNIDKNNNNIINNIRFTRGQSFQPKYNSFLNNKRHLLENAIIKKEFQEPKRKVILKNDLPPSYGMIGANDPSKSFQKIINIDDVRSVEFSRCSGIFRVEQAFAQNGAREQDEPRYGGVL
jgi:hypothetical protein